MVMVVMLLAGTAEVVVVELALGVMVVLPLPKREVRQEQVLTQVVLVVVLLSSV